MEDERIDGKKSLRGYPEYYVLYRTRASASKTGRQAYPTAHPLVCPPPHGSIGLRSSGCGQILSYNCRGTSDDMIRMRHIERPVDDDVAGGSFR